jgi:hypothetical protein
MQYLLIISHDESFAPTTALISDIHAWISEMQARGLRRYGNPLRPPGDAVTIRVRDGKRVLTDGPFADRGEQIAAYELIECADRDIAIEVASRHPMASAATIEVRPVWVELGVPIQA